MARRTVVALLLVLCTASVARAAPPALTASVVGEDPIAGGVFRFPQAVTLSATGGTVFVGDQYSGVVQAFAADGTPRFTLGARATRREPGRLGIVGGVALDRSGHLYVLDSENERVQVFSATDGQPLASFGDASLFDLVGGNPTTGAGISASGIAVDQRPGGPPVVFVADQGKNRISRFVLDPVTLAPVGAPSFSTVGLDAPQGVALDPAGTRLYVADDDNHRVVVLDPSSLQYVTQVGSFGTGPGQFQNPYDVAVDASSPSRLYVADNLNNRVDVFDAGSLASLGSFGGFGRTPGLFSIVRGVGAVADDPRGGVDVADTANNRIQALGADGSVQAAWGIAGRGPGYFTRPRGVAFAPDGGIAIADAFDQRVARFAPDGTYVSQLGLISSFNGFATQGAAAGQLSLPSAVAYGTDGTAWVADTGNNRVQAYAPDTSVRSVAVTAPAAVVSDGAGGVYVAGGPGVVRVGADGSSSTAQSGLTGPSAVAFDGTRLFAADATRVLRAGAAIAPPPGESSWDHPSGLAVDPRHGHPLRQRAAAGGPPAARGSCAERRAAPPTRGTRSPPRGRRWARSSSRPAWR